MVNDVAAFMRHPYNPLIKTYLEINPFTEFIDMYSSFSIHHYNSRRELLPTLTSDCPSGVRGPAGWARSVVYYTILKHTILYYTNTILYYTILKHTILYYTILYYTILFRIEL